MLSKKMVLVLCAAAPLFAQTTVTYSYNGLPLPIYGDAANVITVANVFVPRTLKMTKVTVQIQIQYPNTGDLKVYLYSPVGTRTIIVEHDCSVTNIDTTFDDAATTAFRDFCPTEAGRGPFKADQPLSNFNGDDSSFGTWYLAVENDRSESRSGWITTVSLAITGTPQTAPITRALTIGNAANLRDRGSIAPGGLVSAYGIGLGPDQAVTAPAGNLPTSLGGTSVLVNGTNAPISYASNFRVDFQAPFNLTAGSMATLQINANGQTTTGIQLNVIAASPGIYTQSVDGSGQVMAMNQDGSANGVGNAAAKGSTITLYATGLGPANPAVPAGTAPPNSPLSTVSGVTATIGGMTAPVQFAGLAPGIPGLYQLNIQVPSNAPTGANELLVFVSGTSSQKGATVQVR